MSHSNAIRITGLFFSLFFASLPLFGQGNAGRIDGTITDQSGAAVPKATVTVTDTQRGVARALSTDTAGAYSAPNLTPGTYNVRVEFAGFRTVERKDVLVEVGQEIRVDVSLQPGEQTQTVTVTEEAALVNTSSAELGGTVSNQTINELPLMGRDFENLLSLRPGVTIYPGGGGWTQSTNGMRAHDNVYMLDGVVNMEPWTGQSIVNQATFAGGAGTILPIDAIQEFRTQENPKAEYGWKPGAIVNVGLKSGTNELHGTAYAFGRDGAWDAKNYFSPPGTSPVCVTNPDVCNAPLELKQYGATVGGPIKKDKIFFFGGYEALRISFGNIWQIASPATASGVGTATNNLRLACAAVPAANRAPLSLRLAGLNADCAPGSNYPNQFPIVNGTTPGNFGATTFIPGLTSTSQSDNGIGKVDYHVNERHSLSGKYFIGKNNSTYDDAANELQPYWESFLGVRTQVGSGSWIWTPKANWVNELRGGYNHYFQEFESVDYKVNPATSTAYGNINTGITNPLYYGFPPTTITGFASFRLGGSWPKIVGPDSVLQLEDNASYLRGKHSLRFGFAALQNRFNGTVTANAKGAFRFPNLQSFFSGSLDQASILVGDATRNLSSWGYAGFAQDDWRVTRRLTVNLGIRYELNTVFTDSRNLIGNFDPNQGLVQVGKQISAPFNGDHNNWSPRLGIAWDVFGNGRTVLRAGGSLIYEQLSYDFFMAQGNLLGLRIVPTGAELYANGTQIPSPGTINLSSVTFSGAGPLGPLQSGWFNNGPNTPIFSAAVSRCGDGKSVPSLPSTAPTPQPCNTAAVDPNLRTPYVSTWMVGVQHALSRSLALEAGYIGNHGSKLIQYLDMNQPVPGAGWGSAADPTSQLGKCLASGGTNYNNCSVSSTLEQAARPFNSKFPYLRFIDNIANADISNYDALQSTLTQRFSRGVSFTAGYTWSHALDNASDNWGNSTGIPQDSRNVRNEYGASDFDIRHRFTFSGSYAIPGKKLWGQVLEGWQINNIVTLQTGQPWAFRDSSRDFSGTGEVANQSTRAERWNFFGNPNDFQSSQYPIPFFSGASAPAACTSQARNLDGGAAVGPAQAALANYGCYVRGGGILLPPAFGTYGNEARNMFRDSGFHNWDVSVAKSWTFRERFKAQFRAEFFNVLNHPEFANPGGGPHGGSNADPSTGFGAGAANATPDTAANNPKLGAGANRSMQLGLKLIF